MPELLESMPDGCLSKTTTNHTRDKCSYVTTKKMLYSIVLVGSETSSDTKSVGEVAFWSIAPIDVNPFFRVGISIHLKQILRNSALFCDAVHLDKERKAKYNSRKRSHDLINLVES